MNEVNFENKIVPDDEKKNVPDEIKPSTEEVIEIKADERAFDPSKHMDLVSEKREQFVEKLRSTDLVLLVSMLESSGKKKIEKRKDIPGAWLRMIRKERKNHKQQMFANPKLSFIPDEVCTRLILAELKRRFEGYEEQDD